MSEPKEEQLVQDGDLAEKLLNDETFVEVTNSLVHAAFQSFVNSAPEESKDREKLYHQYRGLVDVHQALQQRVAVRDNIISNRNNNEEE